MEMKSYHEIYSEIIGAQFSSTDENAPLGPRVLGNSPSVVEHHQNSSCLPPSPFHPRVPHAICLRVSPSLSPPPNPHPYGRQPPTPFKQPRPTPYVLTPSPCFRDARRGRKIPKSRESCLGCSSFRRFLRLPPFFPFSSRPTSLASSSRETGEDSSETFARNSLRLSLLSEKFQAFLRIRSSEDKVVQLCR